MRSHHRMNRPGANRHTQTGAARSETRSAARKPRVLFLSYRFPYPLIGGDRIARKGAVVDITYGKGHIVLVGIRAQYRNQSHGTHKFLLNALLYPRMEGMPSQ